MKRIFHGILFIFLATICQSAELNNEKLTQVVLAGIDNYYDSIKVMDAVYSSKLESYRESKDDNIPSSIYLSIIKININDDKIKVIETYKDEDKKYKEIVFDGKRLYTWDSEYGRTIPKEELNEENIYLPMSFLDYVKLRIKIPYPDNTNTNELRMQKVVITGKETVNGYSCYVIKAEPKEENNRFEYISTYWVSPDLNFAIIKTQSTLTFFDKDHVKVRAIINTTDYKNFQKSEDGQTWFPKVIEHIRIEKKVDGKEKILTKYYFIADSLSINGNITAEYKPSKPLENYN